MPMKDFISIGDLTAAQIHALLDRAIADKRAFRRGQLPHTLAGKALAMVFEKQSLRTRVSFETAMTHLGGHAIYLAPGDIGMGSREPIEDVARVLGRMCDGIIARTFAHESVVKLAHFSPSPVINALSDYTHPCQAMADAMTAQEHFGDLIGRTITFVGDGNNVARSLAVLAGKLDMKFILACPIGYELEGPDNAVTMHDPGEAVSSADVIYTDTWVSMGQEAEKQERLKDFTGFQVSDALLAKAPSHAIVMHCLPAYRGNEISADVMERFSEVIFTEAENRLHFQRSLLNVLIAEGGIA